MSDNSVLIAGVVDGAFSNLPSWATQKGLEDIQKILNKIEKNIKANQGSGKAGTNNDDLKAAEKKRKLDKDEIENRTALGRLAKKTNSLFESLNSKTGRLILTLGLVELALGKVWQAVKENADVFDQLYKAGVSVVDVSNGTTSAFQGLAMMANYSSMNLRDFGAVLEAYSGANAVGAVKFAKSLPETQRNLAKFGYDLKGAAEVTGAYLDSMMGFTNMQTRSAEEISDGAIEFGKNISRLSMATGVSRKQLLQQTAAISASTDANIIAIAAGEKAAASASAFAASFKDQQIGQSFIKMMASRIPTLNATFQNFVKGGLGGLGSQLMNFSKSLQGVSPERAALMTKNFVNGLGNLDAVIKQQQFLAEAGVEGAEANVQYLVALKQQANSVKNITEADVLQAEKSAAALNEFKDQWGRLTSIFSRTFSPIIPLLKAMTFALSILNPMLDYVADGFRIIGEGIDYASDAFDYVADKIKSFFAPAIDYVSDLFNRAVNSGNPFVEWLGKAASVFVGTSKVILALTLTVGAAIVAISAFKNMFTAGSIIKNMLGGGGGIASKVAGGLINIIKNAGSFIFGRLGSIVSGMFSKVAGVFTSVGGIALKIFGVVGALYTAFEVGYAIGEQLYKIVSNFDWFNDLMDKVFGGLDKLLQYIPGSVGSDAKDRIQNREKLEAANIAGVTATPIAAATKEPAPSTIKSTSAVPSNPEAANKTAASGTKEPAPAPGSGIERPPGGGDINNLLSYQSSIMEQILQSNKELVAVNKDILKFARIQ